MSSEPDNVLPFRPPCRARVEGRLARLAPYLIVWDTEGRPRVCLLLAPARSMIGIAHVWLPQVPQPSEPRAL